MAGYKWRTPKQNQDEIDNVVNQDGMSPIMPAEINDSNPNNDLPPLPESQTAPFSRADMDSGVYPTPEVVQPPKPKPSLQINATAPRDALRQYLSSKYDQAADTDSVEKASKVNMLMPGLAGIGAGLDRIVSAPSVALGGPGANDQFWANMRQDSQSDLENEENGRKNEIADYLAKKNLGDQAVNQAQQEHIYDKSNESDDPTSQISRVYQAGVVKLYPEIGDNIDVSGLSASDLHNLVKEYNGQKTAEGNASAIQMQNELNKARIDDLNKKDKSIPKYVPGAVGPNGGSVQQLPEGGFEEIQGIKPKPTPKSGNKLNEPVTTSGGYQEYPEKIADNKAKQMQDINGARSKPEFAQAQKDRQAIEKAMRTINKYTGRFDELTPSEVKTIDEEIAKFATGGVPHEAIEKQLHTDTFQERVADLKQKVSNQHQGAGQGDFVRRKLGYLQEMLDYTNNKIAKYYGDARLGRADQLTPQDNVEIDEKNQDILGPYVRPQALNPSDTKPEQSTPRAVPGTIVNIKGRGRFKVDQDGESLIPIQ